MQPTRPHWPVYVKTVVFLLLLVLFISLLFRFSVVLPPLVLAIILAFVLTPLVNNLEYRFKVRRVVAILLSYGIVIIGIGGGLMLVIPLLAEQLSGLNLDIQLFMQQVRGILGHRFIVGGQIIDLDSIFQQASGAFQGAIESIFGQTLGIAVEVITSIVWVIFIIVVSIYLIKDSFALRMWFERLAPPSYRDDFIRLRDEINQIWAAFFRGQLILALVVSCMFSVIGVILGLPFALAMGVLAGLLEFLPSVGHGIWLTIAGLLAYFVGSTWLPIPNWVFALILMGMHMVFQQFDLNYLIPRIIGRSVHLPPLVVILGIVTGAVLAGVLGILLAAPSIASARVIGRYLYANLFDLDPFPDSISHSLPPPDPNWWRKKLSKASIGSDQ